MSDLIWGIKNGDLEQVRESMEKSKIDINEKVDGRAPIHYAADYGQKEVMDFLISSGADVNVLDKHGISPLLAAIWEGHTDCVELLLQRGASSKGTTPEGSSYIDAAEKTEIRELLLKN